VTVRGYVLSPRPEGAAGRYLVGMHIIQGVRRVLWVVLCLLLLWEVLWVLLGILLLVSLLGVLCLLLLVLGVEAVREVNSFVVLRACEVLFPAMREVGVALLLLVVC